MNVLTPIQAHRHAYQEWEARVESIVVQNTNTNTQGTNFVVLTGVWYHYSRGTGRK